MLLDSQPGIGYYPGSQACFPAHSPPAANLKGSFAFKWRSLSALARLRGTIYLEGPLTQSISRSASSFPFGQSPRTPAIAGINK
jgi:hypothetical protein